MAINDITGDNLISRKLSKEGEANWDRIFGKKKKEKYIPPPVYTEDWQPESRDKAIAQNGNTGEHYDKKD